MPGLLELCEEQFGSKDLYTVLDIKKGATSNELRKGYHKVSLKVHPDRVDGKKEKAIATEKFQTLGRVYQLLCDADLRASYDETGEVDEENSPGASKDWVKYWRTLFSKITVQDIVNFEKEYVGHEEEKRDLEAAYKEGCGDLDYILGTVLMCTVDDEPRFRDIIDGWIEEGRVEAYPAYTAEADKKKKQRKRKAAKEAVEAEVAKKELGLGDGDDALKALILSRGQNRAQQMDSFLDSLADKYSKPSAKKGKKTKK